MTTESTGSLFSTPCPMVGKENKIFSQTSSDTTHCSHCAKKVAILAGKTLLEIDAFMRANPSSCIMIGGKINFSDLSS